MVDTRERGSGCNLDFSLICAVWAREDMLLSDEGRNDDYHFELQEGTYINIL